MTEPVRPIIQVKNLVARYGDRTVLDGVTCDVARGEIFLILGASGSGKSTLMRHLIGLQRATSGQIAIDGVDVLPDDPDRMEVICRKIGMMFQNGALFGSMTLAENIGLPLKEHTALDNSTILSVVAMKLGMVNLSGAESLYPSELSGGMRKRAAIARAMALDPEILFFDEPSAGLDPITAVELDELILQINGTLGTTIVIITHELSSIHALARHAILLSEGKTLAVGTLEEIQRHGGQIARRFFERAVSHPTASHSETLDRLLDQTTDAGNSNPASK